ncbi:MAG TPA: UDP-N-acetylglucosamine 2-epimerase (hydrolyzing) [Bacteroidales bacterium]|nr:UDP-N-acetylglucosamine 2-epimerase (hydrolyzing) [Bacteroidales bacterium]
MKVGILTSTRADFGIYLPLIKELIQDTSFDIEIIAFGTHLSKEHGYTLNEITNSGFSVKHKLQTVPGGDKSQDIAKSIGKTTLIFSDFWNNNKFDFVFALGDRYEMFAAVTAGTPFNVKFVHLHAGETTLGAIDNAYRHSISLMSEYLFVSTEIYKTRAAEITGKTNNVFNVGALSIDNLKKVKLFSIQDFKIKFNIDLNKPTILSTFHPETVSLEKNEEYIKELLNAFDELKEKYQIVITMPNADTMGLTIRKKIETFAENKNNIILIKSFGMKGYLTCMKYCSFLLGNTSSGFVEAAFFPKWVINLGDRQKGRIVTKNIFSIPVEKTEILKTVDIIERKKPPVNCNIYGNGNTAQKIVKILKQLYTT